jgi:hypothetical protein
MGWLDRLLAADGLACEAQRPLGVPALLPKPHQFGCCIGCLSQICRRHAVKDGHAWDSPRDVLRNHAVGSCQSELFESYSLHITWGGWGSNPRPADYENYGPVHHAR